MGERLKEWEESHTQARPEGVVNLLDGVVGRPLRLADLEDEPGGLGIDGGRMRSYLDPTLVPQGRDLGKGGDTSRIHKNNRQDETNRVRLRPPP